MGLLAFEWSGLNSIDADVKLHKETINNIIPPSLGIVGAEMKEALKRHIESDFYAAYSPKSYPRRKDSPNYGTPLNSDANIHVFVQGSALSFGYFPDGSHTGIVADSLNWKDYSERRGIGGGTAPLVPYPVHGDELIQRLQNARYNWATSAPPRPFWNNFVNDMMSGGIINTLKAAFFNSGYSLIAENNELAPAAAESIY